MSIFDFSEVKVLREELAELEERLRELEELENVEEYDQMLDETGLDPNIFLPSFLLKEADPIAYDLGHTDYNDSLITEVLQEIEDKKEEIKQAQII